MSEKVIREFDDEYAEGQIVEGFEDVATNKKKNVEYWDHIEGHVFEAFLAVARAGGVEINYLFELRDIKELTENMIERVKKQYPEAKYPFVDEDF